MPDIVYLHGFASSSDSEKGRFFHNQFGMIGTTVHQPELVTGPFHKTTMTAQLGVVDRVIRAHRPSMVIGSSLGGYLAALYGARHPDLAPVVVMLAPAFDFVRQWTRKLGPEALQKWRQTGKLSVYHHGQRRMENLGYEFYTDAIRYEAWPKLRQPALIFHGQYDDVVYPSSSVQYVWSNMSAEMELVESGHELTDVLDEIWPKMLQFYRRAEPF